MSQVQVIRGQTRASVLRKIEPLLAAGWQLQGPVAQESGWGNSTRYSATLVCGPSAASTHTIPAIPQMSDPTLSWAVAEIQKLQQHCQSLEARVRKLERADPSAGFS